jgi:hypothetical protein
LGVLVGADRGIDLLIGHNMADLFALLIRDDLQKQINRRRAAAVVRRLPSLMKPTLLVQLQSAFCKTIVVFPSGSLARLPSSEYCQQENAAVHNSPL